MTGRRSLLLAVASLLTASAALAIAILLFGNFGETEGRILATTALLAAHGLLALPGAILLDQRRLRPLAAFVLALAASAATVNVASVWTEDPPAAVGKTSATLLAFLVASTQTAALTARRRGRPRALFFASTADAFVVATTLAVVVWAEIDSESVARVLGALVVLDVLLVALQPILSRARRGISVTRLAVTKDAAAETVEAIRVIERQGRRVVRVEIATEEAVAREEPQGALVPARSAASEDDQARDREVRDDREQILDHGRKRP